MGLKSRISVLQNRLRRQYAEWTSSDSYCRRGRDDLDLLLAAFLPANGSYTEAGALDGFSFSNTYDLDRVKGWNGLLVEPNPPEFEECLRFRRLAHVVQCALVPFDCSAKTATINYGADLTWTEGAYTGEEEKTPRNACKVRTDWGINRSTSPDNSVVD